MNLDQAKITFVEEARELLQVMEEVLLRAESGECDEEAVNALFRSAHTIKGSAGLFGFDAIVAFTHVVENALDRVREGELALEGNLVGLLLECRDHIGVLLTDAAEHGEQADDASTATGSALVERLRAHLDPAASGKSDVVPPCVPAPREEKVESLGGGAVASDTWHISLRFGHEVFRNGMDPLSFIRYLGENGTVVHVETLLDAIPPASEMDPESCYLGFEIDLKSERDKAAIEAVFEFVREDCQVRILPPGSKLEEYIRLIEELPEHAMRIGEILVKGGALTERELEAALALQEAHRHASGDGVGPPLGEIMVGDGLAPAAAVSAALEKQKRIEEKHLQETKFLKVPAQRLDQLIDLVGELVIAGAGAAALAAREKHAAMIEASSIVSGLVDEIRDSTLRLRMVQIGETFSRFPRVVRDVAKELGKQIELVVNGAETELDKSMVEHLGDPLMHLMRNAMDHGIEPTEQRIARGKPAKGTVKLNACHDSGSIVIEVGDDGGGLNKDKIRAKAIEKGLLPANASPTEAELFKLVLEPGFSTAAAVTNLSGRGVGMDVVRRNIEALRGSIEIESREGEGSTFRIRMPLTLAIIDGFQVQVDEASYVIPLDMVVECVELTQAAKDDAKGSNYINLRGEVLPFLRLREVFESDGPMPTRENIVVVNYGGKRAGLVVDKLLGELQTVIKPLSKLFSHIKGIGGSTILGTGEVALIVDVPSLIQHAMSTQSHTHEPGSLPRVQKHDSAATC